MGGEAGQPEPKQGAFVDAYLYIHIKQENKIKYMNIYVVGVDVWLLVGFRLEKYSCDLLLWIEYHLPFHVHPFCTVAERALTS